MKKSLFIVLSMCLLVNIIAGCGIGIDRLEDESTCPSTNDQNYNVSYDSQKSNVSFNEQINCIDADGEDITLSQPDIQRYIIGEREQNSEEYHYEEESEFKRVTNAPFSTFSIDVDTAGYSNIRRYLMDGMMPPIEAVRIEEMINYFTYDYDEPKGNEPFSINTEFGICPWNDDHYLAMIGVQGKQIEKDELPPSNLIFLIDVSGSMNNPDKLPLLKSGFKLLVNQLDEDDNVSIVVYAGAAGVVLEGARGDEKEKIIQAINNLHAGGSTAGGAGINLAYKIAKDYFKENGNNRVILATDGDFNIGISSEKGLENLIVKRRKDNVFLSVLGFGKGNIKDNKMETLADKGNGNYAYIDSILEAKKVLVNEMGGTLFTIAKDVKIQIEFNPANVAEYRLIGYDNRRLADEDFNDDKKDAGELGAGHTVTAIYEIVPIGAKSSIGSVDDLKYQENKEEEKEINSKYPDELMLVKLRYKEPDEDSSKKIERIVTKSDIRRTNSYDFYFASAVAEFGLLLKDSDYKGESNYDHVLSQIRKYKGDDKEGYKSQLLHLVELSQIYDN